MSSQPASQPDSIDLAYDMWAGQFEFVGPTAAVHNSQKSSLNNTLTFGDKTQDHKQSTDSLEDLNLNFGSQHSQSMTNSAYSLGCSGYETDYGKQPILIDQETFLSLNPADFEDIVPSSSGPNSLIFIDNKLVDSEYINNNNNNNKLINLESLTNKCNNKTNNTNTNGFKLENLKNFKNKLICDYEEKSENNNNNNSSLHNNNNNKMNGISLEMCENLNEQVSIFFLLKI